jgi:hypothetical protein
MATTRKSAKRTARKKTSGRKRASAGKKATRTKAVSRRSSPKAKAVRKKKGTALRRRAAQGLRAARGGVKSVRQAGDKIWEALRSTTAHVVEGVKDRLTEENEREARDRS